MGSRGLWPDVGTGHQSSQSMVISQHTFHVVFSKHLVQGIYQISCIVLSAAADDVQSSDLCQSKVVMLPWHMSFAWLGIKHRSFICLLPSTSGHEDRQILTTQAKILDLENSWWQMIEAQRLMFRLQLLRRIVDPNRFRVKFKSLSLIIKSVLKWTHLYGYQITISTKWAI